MGKYGGFFLTAVIFIFIQTMGELTLPSKMQVIIDKGITGGDTSAIGTAGAEMLMYAAMISVSAVIASLLTSICGSGFAKNLRRAIFHKVTGASNNQINQFGTASLITRTTNDVNQLQQLVVMSRMMVMAPIMGIGGIIMAVRTAQSLSWIIIAVVLLVVIMVFFIMRKAMPLFKIQQTKLDNLNRVLREQLTGVRVIRAFNRTKKEQKRFEETNGDLTATALKVARIMAVMMPISMVIMNLTTVSITWFAAQYIDQGILELGQMAAFMQYVMHVMFSIMMVSMIFVLVPRASVSADRINAVLDSNNEIKNKDSFSTIPGNKRGTLTFNDVTFRFKGAENPVLTNISFTASPGQTTAIIGSTGSGKSTLIDLIPRFYDIESGEILLDGVNIADLDLKDLRSRIGLVPQQALLFTGTIADNLRYGKEDATDEELRRAAETAQAIDFIEKKPDGFNSNISQGGTNLSGGQKQRLSIARALIRKPELYIFDDSFSALDFKTDAKLRAALKSEITDAAMLVVAQRVSSIMDADQIIVLNDGQLVGKGTHKELYETCDVYKEIVLSQHSEEEIA